MFSLYLLPRDALLEGRAQWGRGDERCALKLLLFVSLNHQLLSNILLHEAK